MKNGCSQGCMLLCLMSVLPLPHTEPRDIPTSASRPPHTSVHPVVLPPTLCSSLLELSPSLLESQRSCSASAQSIGTATKANKAPTLQHPCKQIAACIAKDAAAANAGVGWSCSAPHHPIYLLPQCPAGAHLQDGDRDQQWWQGTMRPLGAQLCEGINQAS